MKPHTTFDPRWLGPAAPLDHSVLCTGRVRASGTRNANLPALCARVRARVRAMRGERGPRGYRSARRVDEFRPDSVGFARRGGKRGESEKVAG